MTNINIEVLPLECESPILGDIHRNESTTGSYIFNWTTKADLYESYGLNVDVSLWYRANGGTPVKYTANPVPKNAVNFEVLNSDIGNGNYAHFVLILKINNGDVCTKEVDIMYGSDIVIN